MPARWTEAPTINHLANRLVLLGLLVLCPASFTAKAQPPSVDFCAVCHGETGPSPFIGVPTIHGLPEGVIESALHSFREGLRPCRTTACSAARTCPDISMCDIVVGMSEQELAELAQWYAAQPFAPHQDPFDPALAAIGRELHDKHCEICHTNFGSDPIDDASMLRGQRRLYLRTALADFKQGRRSIGLAAMEDLIKGFSDEQLDALAEFFSGPAVDVQSGD